jgi:hypothetical protein
VHAALWRRTLRYLERVVDRDPSQFGNLHGWIRRAVCLREGAQGDR